jgi:formylmethanofuran:tetrahydromethanopterin formyltransferase
MLNQYANPLIVKLEAPLINKLEQFYVLSPLRNRRNLLKEQMDVVSKKLATLQTEYEKSSALLDEELKKVKVLEPDFSIDSLIGESSNSLLIGHLLELTELTEKYAELAELFNAYESEFVEIELEIIALQSEQYQLS